MSSYDAKEALAKQSLQQFSRTEFLRFVQAIYNVETKLEAEHDAWANHFAKLVPHRSGMDLLFWPEDGADDSPEGIIAEIERACREKGLVCFRDD